MTLEQQYIALREDGQSAAEVRLRMGLHRSVAERFAGRYAGEKTGQSGRTFWPTPQANENHVAAIYAECSSGFAKRSA